MTFHPWSNFLVKWDPSNRPLWKQESLLRTRLSEDLCQNCSLPWSPPENVIYQNSEGKEKIMLFYYLYICIHIYTYTYIHIYMYINIYMLYTNMFLTVTYTSLSDEYHLRSTRKEAYVQKMQQNSRLTCSTPVQALLGELSLIISVLKRMGYGDQMQYCYWLNKSSEATWEIKVAATVSHLYQTSFFHLSIYFPSSLVKHCTVISIKLVLRICPHQKKGLTLVF